MFGGKDDENCKLNDLWTFDLTALTWTELTPVGANGVNSNQLL